MSTQTLGGERLGSGGKQKIHLHNYERSTHDLSTTWRSTMSAGTLVPFFTEVALPGDTFDIDVNANVLTHPTIGPLFGSYKVQIDFFQVPVRLYVGQLYMNKNGIGMKMGDVKLPQIYMKAPALTTASDMDNQQINPSSIFNHLNIRGLGQSETGEASRKFNAVPFLAYWDIYKNYYANKQEEKGAVIHNELLFLDPQHMNVILRTNTENGNITLPNNETAELEFTKIDVTSGSLRVTTNSQTFVKEMNNDNIEIYLSPTGVGNDARWYKIGDVFAQVIEDIDQLTKTWWTLKPEFWWNDVNTSDPLGGGGGIIASWYIGGFRSKPANNENEIEPTIKMFDLENIDKMRENILSLTQSGVPLVITGTSIEPYGLPFKTRETSTKKLWSQLSTQEGLALKTYQSDLFNNWISTEWIDGNEGINEITKINISDNSFTLDELRLNNKIYDMLMRIAVSGGTYYDWLDATYTHEAVKAIQNPVYMGGLIKELTFEEVISTAESPNSQPLGTLAGRGVMTNKHKGGKIRIKTDEHSYIMGIVSLTPRLDYSQGNKWDVNLKTMDDFHKPALDQIGFQELLTDQMAFWDTTIAEPKGSEEPRVVFKSAGKQPAWINYMTNVNQIKGNFAIRDEQQFMVLARRYEPIVFTTGSVSIKDLTTYIDPSKFNHIFAYTRRDAQNFWVQIRSEVTARRKMSAKVMPNL